MEELGRPAAKTVCAGRPSIIGFSWHVLTRRYVAKLGTASQACVGSGYSPREHGRCSSVTKGRAHQLSDPSGSFIYTVHTGCRLVYLGPYSTEQCAVLSERITTALEGIFETDAYVGDSFQVCHHPSGKMSTAIGSLAVPVTTKD